MSLMQQVFERNMFNVLRVWLVTSYSVWAGTYIYVPDFSKIRTRTSSGPSSFTISSQWLVTGKSQARRSRVSPCSRGRTIVLLKQNRGSFESCWSLRMHVTGQSHWPYNRHRMFAHDGQLYTKYAVTSASPYPALGFEYELDS